jgi:hypothetical protein
LNWVTAKRLMKQAIMVLCIVAIISILSDVVYGVLLPRFFPGHQLGDFLAPVLCMAIALASISSGYVGIQGLEPGTNSRRRWETGISFAVWTALLTLYFVLFAIVNTYGS